MIATRTAITWKTPIMIIIVAANVIPPRAQPEIGGRILLGHDVLLSGVRAGPRSGRRLLRLGP